MVSYLVKYILVCLLLTEILELGIIKVLGVKNKKNFLVIFLINVVTNLILSYITFLLSVYKNISFYDYVFMAEITIIVVEGIMLDNHFDYEAEDFFINKITKNKKLKSMIFSVIINIISIVIGSAIVQIVNLFNF